MQQPVFYLLAGPNGAGKSSLYRAVVAAGLIPAEAEFVNADLYEAAKLGHLVNPQERSEQARLWADARRAALLIAGKTFVSETVFSHESKLALIADAKRSGFAVVLLVVCMDDTKRLVLRVQQRVREGGHDVPADRVLARYPRTLKNLASAVRMADLAILYDSGETSANQGANKEISSAPSRVAECRGGETIFQARALPEWARLVLG